ncbi:MAG: response regulator transcription factor [Halobacteriaceae archaeon]
MDQNTATVVVVEDEAGLADLYAEWLRDEYSVVTAMTVDEATDVIDEETDIVLLDRRLPDGSGDEVLNAIRERGYECRVAMVTAVDPDFDVIKMGFDEYLLKPIDKEELQETVATLLKRREYDDRIQRYASLLAKQASLTSTKSEIELANSDEYAELQEEIADLQQDISEQMDEFDNEDFRSLFLNIGSEMQEKTRREASQSRLNDENDSTNRDT